MRTHPRLARCIGCGCDDFNACCDTETAQPCSWVRIDRDAGVGVCSACPDVVEAWDRGERHMQVPA